MMERTVRLDATDVLEFAVASRDVNPLHTDEDFARRTSYGRTVAHGALVVLTALARVPADRFGRLRCLTADFLAPLHPGVPYDVCTGPGTRSEDIRVRCLGEPAALVRLKEAPSRVTLLARLPLENQGRPVEESARAWLFDDLRT